MLWTNIMVFLLVYSGSYVILYFILLKSNLGRWISKKNKRKTIALLILFIVCMLGNIVMDKLRISGILHYIVKGLLFSLLISIIPFITPKKSKIKA